MMLNCECQSEWYGRSLYELIHPDDIEKLREQLSTNETQPPGRILDLKSTYPIHGHCAIFSFLVQRCFVRICAFWNVGAIA